MTRDEFDPLLLANRDCVANYFHNRYRHDISEDLLQDTYTSAIAMAGSYDPQRCHIRTWLIAILRRQILLLAKYHRNHPPQSDDAYIPDGRCDLYITYDYDVIMRELCTLTFHQRRVVVSLLQGLKTREMGRCFPKIKDKNQMKQGVKHVRNEIRKKLILAEAV